MSIAVRWPVGPDGDVVCDWGLIEHPDPRPDRGEVGHLVLVARDTVIHAFTEGPCVLRGMTYSVDAIPDDDPPAEDSPLRLFAHLDHDGRRWTWELFDAHFADGIGPGVYVGRWPD